MGEQQVTGWRSQFDERQLKEIEMCEFYVRRFNHGASNHNIMTVVAKMAGLLDQAMGYDARELAKKVVDQMVKGI